MEEARALYDAKVNGRASLLPVRLDDSKAPELLAPLHYARLRNRSPADIVEQFLQNLDPE